MDDWPVWLQSPISAGLISGLIFGVIFIVIPAVRWGWQRYKEVIEDERIKACKRQIRMRKYRRLKL